MRKTQNIVAPRLWTSGLPENNNSPNEFALPLCEWVMGLGNLGQAHLWCLALLPYPNPQDVHLTLQDFDRIRAENWGTSLFVERNRYGALKSARAESWCTARGFQTHRIDLRLDQSLRRQEDEPALAVAGLDRVRPRRHLSEVGFDHIFDVGLGASADTYAQFRVTHFDGGYTPRTHFNGVSELTEDKRLQGLPVYQALLRAGKVDACGVAMLAGFRSPCPS